MINKNIENNQIPEGETGTGMVWMKAGLRWIIKKKSVYSHSLSFGILFLSLLNVFYSAVGRKMDYICCCFFLYTQ